MIRTYVLRVFREDGSAERVWSFEASDDDNAKQKAALYLKEQFIASGQRVELHRDGGKVAIDWQREQVL